MGLSFYLGEESTCVKMSEFNIFKKHFDSKNNILSKNYTLTQLVLTKSVDFDIVSRFDYDLSTFKELEELFVGKGLIDLVPGLLYRSVLDTNNNLGVGCRIVLEEIGNEPGSYLTHPCCV